MDRERAGGFLRPHRARTSSCCSASRSTIRAGSGPRLPWSRNERDQRWRDPGPRTIVTPSGVVSTVGGS